MRTRITPNTDTFHAVIDIRFVGHKNITPSKYMNLSGLQFIHLGTPILTVDFLNVLNSLDS